MDKGVALKLSQQTDYPWDGRVRLAVTPDQASEFAVCLRIPGWALGRPVPSDLYRFANSEVSPVALKVNGRATDASPQDDGYIRLHRRWQAGDVVELELPMPVQRVYAHEKIKDDQGKVALMRGPIVYCLEAVDHPGTDSSRFVLPREAPLQAERRPTLLGGVTIVQGKALVDGQRPVTLSAVPYYAWANRERGPMVVWMAEAP
jgi:hypothetical protein